MADPSRRRLDSWKEISTYVGREVRTVARWENERGLPVHRVPGGRIVFGWTDEIDRWLAGEGQHVDAVLSPPDAAPTWLPARRWRYTAFALVAIATVTAVALWAGMRSLRRTAVAIADIEVRTAELIAVGPDGDSAWTYQFSQPMTLDRHLPSSGIGDIAGDGAPQVLAVLSQRDDRAGQQALYCFSNQGQLRWRRSFNDTLTFGGESFAPPWNSAQLLVHPLPRAAQMVWVIHHHTWWPSVALLLDADGREVSRFVNPGWITSAAIAPGGNVLLAGTNNAEQSDVFIVTDGASWPGSAPSAFTSDNEYECRTCPSGTPLEYFLLPRSEIARLLGTPGDVTHIHPYQAGVEIAAQQIPRGDTEPTADLIFDFSADFQPIRVRASDAYWAWHKRLESEHKLDHSADRCPERRGVTVRVWRRDTGWSSILVPASAR